MPTTGASAPDDDRLWLYQPGAASGRSAAGEAGLTQARAIVAAEGGSLVYRAAASPADPALFLLRWRGHYADSYWLLLALSFLHQRPRALLALPGVVIAGGADRRPFAR